MLLAKALNHAKVKIRTTNLVSYSLFEIDPNRLPNSPHNRISQPDPCFWAKSLLLQAIHISFNNIPFTSLSSTPKYLIVMEGDE
jgi:hypothetical protein